MRTVIIPERWERLIDLIEERGRASVEEIARELSVSMPTVRRDLARIHGKGLIRRTRGGAERSEAALRRLTLMDSSRVNTDAKEAIGRAAAELIQPGECVMIDGGFTTYQVARHIQASDLKVVTNSFDVAQALAGKRGVKIVMLGGEMLVDSGTTVGPTTERQLGELVGDRAFLGANAISPAFGLCADIQHTAETKKAMISDVREVVVVADHSKLGKSALHRVAPIEAVSVLVTDDGADEDLIEAFRSAGVAVVIVGTQDTSGGSSSTG